MITKSFVTARYAETDQMGVIHHSVYAVWYELARTDFIKKVGISYSKMEEMGILLPLSELTCKYHQATLYEDEITIETRILALTPSRIQFGYTVYKKGVEKPVFYNFFNFIYSKISKKLGFRGSAFPFPPFSLEGGKKK